MEGALRSGKKGAKQVLAGFHEEEKWEGTRRIWHRITIGHIQQDTWFLDGKG